MDKCDPGAPSRSQLSPGSSVLGKRKQGCEKVRPRSAWATEMLSTEGDSHWTLDLGDTVVVFAAFTPGCPGAELECLHSIGPCSQAPNTQPCTARGQVPEDRDRSLLNYTKTPGSTGAFGCHGLRFIQYQGS